MQVQIRCFFGALILVAAAQLYADQGSYFSVIGSEVLSSYNIVEADSDRKPEKEKVRLDVAHLERWEREAICFRLFDQYEQLTGNRTNTVIDGNTRIAMGLLCGEKPHTENNLLALFEPETTPGRAVTALKLVSPTTDIHALRKTQAVIDAFKSDEQLYAAAQRLLQAAHRAEDALFGLWRDLDKLTQQAYDQMYLDLKKPLIKELNRLNQNEAAMNTRFFSGIISPTAAITGLPLSMLGSFFTVCKFNRELEFEMAVQENSWVRDQYGRLIGQRARDEAIRMALDQGHQQYTFFQAGASGLRSCFKELRKIDLALVKKAQESIVKVATENPREVAAGVGVYGSLLGLMGYSYINGIRTAVNRFNHSKDVVKSIQQKLIYVAEFTRAAEELARLCAANDACVQGIESLTLLQDFFGKTGAVSKELQALLRNLNSATFTGTASYFSNIGRVLVTYRQLHQVKDQLTPVLYAVGEIDAYYAAAKLMKKFDGMRVGFNFATYLSEARPSLQLNEFWNPFVNPAVVVCNSCGLGTDSNLCGRSMIITGPNAGGKSTIMKGIVFNVLLAQTFGICCADSCVLTPFAKINTYLNIQDDTAAGKSLFKAESLRARDLIATIEQLHTDEFSLSMLDEVFCGTAPKEGAAASYSVAHYLARFDNSIAIMATHFVDDLPHLEQATNGIYHNYKVCVNKDATGKLVYPFRLERGVTDQNVAIDILREDGFDIAILKEAYDRINRIPITAQPDQTLA